MTMNTPPSYHDGMRRVGQAYLCKGGNVGQGYHSHGMVPTLTKVWARFLPIYFPHSGESLPKMNEREFKPNRHYGKGHFRRASVREVMRLQGFPDDYTAIPKAADGPRYKALGNSMAVPVMAWIGKRIANALA